MGCDGGLLSAGGSVEPLIWVVQELCNLYHGGACLDVLCRVKSGQVGSSRYKSGQSGRYFFSGNFLSLRFCIGFSVSRVDSWFWQPLHDTHPRLSQTPDASRSAGGWGAGCRVRTLQVGLSGQKRAVFLYMDFCVWLRARSIAVSVGLWVDRLYAVYSLARVLPRLQIPSQSESWVHDDDTLSAVPIRISVQGYYITVLDAIVLCRHPDQGYQNQGSRITHKGRRYLFQVAMRCYEPKRCVCPRSGGDMSR